MCNLLLLMPTATRAVEVANRFQDSIVLNGNILDASLMREGGIEDAETFVALTGDDEANILSAVVAKQLGCKKVITLYNNASYGNIMRSLDIDAYISPRALTVSAILRHVRRGRIAALHSIHDGAAEAMEVEALAASRMVGRPLGELNLPKNVMCLVLSGAAMLSLFLIRTRLFKQETMSSFLRSLGR